MARGFVDGFGSCALKWFSEAENTDRVVPNAYWDPKLKASLKAYHDFITMLAEARVVAFTQTCQERVGAFFVKNKSRKLRLIVDFRAPMLGVARRC